MNNPDIEAIRQSPRQYVDLETVEALSDYAINLEQQLVDAQKHIVMLRTACKSGRSAPGFFSHSAVKAIEFAVSATDHLKDYALCDAKPVAWMATDQQGGTLFFRNDVSHIPTTPLYKKRTP